MPPDFMIFYQQETINLKNKHGKEYVNRNNLLYKYAVMQETIYYSASCIAKRQLCFFIKKGGMCSSKPGNRNTERRTRNIVKPELVAYHN